MAAGLRHAYLDRAKGLAILLVVVGHVVARQPPAGAEWYSLLKDRIYIFHMPLFVFLSGLAFGFSFRAPTGVADYFQGLQRRTARLLAGYFALGLVIFAGKLAFQQFTAVDNPVRGPEALLDLLLRPAASFSSFLWYVYALSLLYAAVPLLFKAGGQRLWPLLLLGAALPFLPTSTLLAWNKLQELSLYFVLGLAAGRHHDRFEALLQRAWLPALLGFAALLPWVPKGSLWAWACCLCAIVGLLGLLRASWLGELKLLQVLGAYTLSIYLFNTIFIGVAKAAWVGVVGWEGAKFIPAFAVLLAAGLLVPVALKRWVFVRVAPLDRIT